MNTPFKMAQPMIPGGLLHTMYEVRAGGHYDQDKGGQWVAGEPVRVPFEGAVLPVSDKDLRSRWGRRSMTPTAETPTP